MLRRASRRRPAWAPRSTGLATVDGEDFDVVHARMVLLHVPERDRALASMASAVRPGGWLVLEDATIRQIGDDLIANDLATAPEIDDHLAYVASDPGQFATSAIVTAWGHKPSP